MNLEQFTLKMKEALEEYLGERAHIEKIEVTKNNGVKLQGLTFSFTDSMISPTVYMEDIYRNYECGRPLSFLVSYVAGLLEEEMENCSINLAFFSDYEQVKAKLGCKLINFERNQDYLKDLPHVRFLDLAVTFYCYVTNELFGSGTITICKEHLSLWGIDVQRLYQDAMCNVQKIMPLERENMERIMKELWTEEGHESSLGSSMFLMKECPVEVLTNKKRLFGAVSMIYPGVLEDFSKVCRTGFYIIPSSIHEVLLIPDNNPDFDWAGMKDYIKEVNRKYVKEEEVLSDSLYHYDHVLKEVRMH